MRMIETNNKFLGTKFMDDIKDKTDEFFKHLKINGVDDFGV